MGEDTARIVQQVVLPVSSATPILPVIDMDMIPPGAAPETTMGPGQLAEGTAMPALFAKTETDEQ